MKLGLTSVGWGWHYLPPQLSVL